MGTLISLAVFVLIIVNNAALEASFVNNCVPKFNCENPSKVNVADGNNLAQLLNNNGSPTSHLTSGESTLTNQQVGLGKINRGRPGPVVLSKRSRRSLVVPGTNWCGVDKISKDSKTNGATDQCCKDHDHCNDTINSFSRKHHLFNYQFYSISHCDCDERFRTCLHNADGLNIFVGRLYFNYIGMKCFVLVQKSVCLERAWWGWCQREATEWTAELRDPLPF